MPAIADISADIANLVDDPTTTANSGVYFRHHCLLPRATDPRIFAHYDPTIPLAHVHWRPPAPQTNSTYVDLHDFRTHR